MGSNQRLLKYMLLPQKTYIDIYEYQNYCLDPFKVHETKYKTGLRSVSLNLAQDFRKVCAGTNLPPGCKLCKSCRQRINISIEVNIYTFLSFTNLSDINIQEINILLMLYCN